MTYNQPETMAYYRELEAKDEDVANCLDTLRLSVMERDRSVDAYDDSQAALDVQTLSKIRLPTWTFIRCSIACSTRQATDSVCRRSSST